ncbi:hypothetical protein [Pseudonocardia sp.]|jgi:hypothetical protein|uniref:hypothetical protein n=1 Tax=Pseudonocardia sp. TaxID=60912 RepID=UPI002F41064E
MSLSVRTSAFGIAAAAGLVASAGLVFSAPAPTSSAAADTVSPAANTVLLAGCHRWWDRDGRHHYYCRYRDRDHDNGLIVLHHIL